MNFGIIRQITSRPRKSNCRGEPWSSIFIYSWRRWGDREPIYHPIPSNQTIKQNTWNNDFPMWDIRQPKIVMADRGLTNEVSDTIPQVSFWREFPGSCTGRGMWAEYWVSMSWRERSPGSQDKGLKRRELHRELQRSTGVPLESSV